MTTELSLPSDGRPQDKGGNKDSQTWRVVNMRDDASLFKVVDDNNKNIADLFHTQENAEQFISYHKSKQEECRSAGENRTWDYFREACVGGGPTGGNLDENGVLLMYKRLEGGKQVIDRDLPTGNGDLEGQGYVIDQRDDGVRYNIKGDYANSFDIGLYANIDSDDDDEVSFKTYGGTHDKNNPKFCRCYDVGIQFDGRQVRLRTEHEHNANGGGPYVEVESKAINIGNITKKWVGFRFIGIHTGEGDSRETRLVTFVDTSGLTSDGKPLNRWSQIADWTDEGNEYFNKTQEHYDKPLQHGPPYGKYPYPNGKPQQTIRIESSKKTPR